MCGPPFRSVINAAVVLETWIDDVAFDRNLIAHPYRGSLEELTTHKKSFIPHIGYKYTRGSLFSYPPKWNCVGSSLSSTKDFHTAEGVPFYIFRAFVLKCICLICFCELHNAFGWASRRPTLAPRSCVPPMFDFHRDLFGTLFFV